LVQCKQAGLFEIHDLNDTQLDVVLNVACAQILYPYLRSNVTDLIVRGGFTPVNLTEINFRAVYEQRKVQRLQKQLTQKQAVQKTTAPAPAPTSSTTAQRKKKKTSN